MGSSLVQWSKNFFSLILPILFFIVLFQQVHGSLPTCWKPYPFRICIARVWYNTVKKREQNAEVFQNSSNQIFLGEKRKAQILYICMWYTG